MSLIEVFSPTVPVAQPVIERPLPGDLDRRTVLDFLAGTAGHDTLPAPPWGPIGREVYERTYSREVPTGTVGADGQPAVRKEVWAETVRRVVLGNLGLAPQHTALPDEAARLFATIYLLRAVPAGRHLWVTGVEKISSYGRNCYVSGWGKRVSDHVAFLAARLFEGGGVGANYSADLRSEVPPIVRPVEMSFTIPDDHPDLDTVRAAAGERFVPAGTHMFGAERVVVDDSREGWVGLWCRMLDAAGEPGDGPVRWLVDLSEVRPHGSPLRTFGGRASGPAPLVTSCVNIARLVNGAVGRGLSGLEWMGVDHEIAAAVVSGGARRSARLAVMHWADPEIGDFLVSKADQSAHWSTNISVEIDGAFRAALDADDPAALSVLDRVCEGMVANGEPGLLDTGLASETEPYGLRAANPCGESFLATDPEDAAGEACNLGSVDLACYGTDLAGAAEAVELMARYLYRATLNQHPSEPARRIETVNRRIGVGIMGLQGWAAAHGRKLSDIPASPDLLANLTTLRVCARVAADTLADTLGTPRPVKVTAVAPTGTIAQLRGSTSGIHPTFARRFVRRVRYADSDPALPGLIAQGYDVVDDIYAASTKVVSFPVTDISITRWPEELIEQADEIGIDAFLDLLAAVQRTFCGGRDGQAVSATGSIPAGYDPAELARSVRSHLGKVKGLTVFPALSRDLAPLEAIDVATFEAMSANIVGGYQSADLGDSNPGGCAGGACPVR